ncbi:mucin-5AC-like [Haliotis rubra]|uniref:mucin-5AC-like n=1 Tax=Haliotis rubra TaxID=36100 RepID=UPI001EE62D5C|nr:mucin-5AC-like [Haliotis rubra]XP_046577752.1 mucin-5AC-like [Haliotis rubra]
MFVLHLVFVIMSVQSSLSFPLTCTLVVINKSASTNKTNDGIEIIPNVQVDAFKNSFDPSTIDTSTTPGKDAAPQQPYTDSNGPGIEMVTLSTTKSVTITQPESAPAPGPDNQTSAAGSTVSLSDTTAVDKTVDEKTTTSDTTIKETTAADVTVETKVTAEETSNADTAVKETTTSPDATVKETTTTADTTVKETTTTADTTVKETTSIPYYDDEHQGHGRPSGNTFYRTYYNPTIYNHRSSNGV